jgi:MFS transporter, SP family, sugar:H+ symporter
MYAFNHIFAGFIASIITNFTSKIPNDDSWRIPVGCILIFPCLVLILSFLVPESPRWLLRKGRFQEAVDNIYYLRSSKPDYPAEEEANLIMDAINNATSQGKWSELFKGTNAVSLKIILSTVRNSAYLNSFRAVRGLVLWQPLLHN